MRKNKKTKGSILITIVIFSFIFTLSLVAVSGLIITEHKLTMRKVANSQALQIAEAGLNYYRWRLAHDPDDLSDTTSQPYYDAQGNLLGYYSVTIEASTLISYGQRVTLCHKPGTSAERTIIVAESALSAHLAHGDYEGECDNPAINTTNIILITATGWADGYPTIQRQIKARYGQPSLARYAFITNSNVWFGNTEEIAGQVHSNGGIRMDGTCDARMTSIKETYICGEEHGCSDEEKPGIWGTGTRQDLWDFPITEGIDFDAVTVDLDEIKTAADTGGGEYFEPSGSYGYKIVFNSNGTYDVRKVTKLENPVWSYNGTEWIYASQDYKNTSNVGTYTIPSNGLIFVEDDLWIEGTVDGRATVAAARLPDEDYEDANVYITNNLTYTSKDGISALGLIAQKDILVPLYSADNLEIDAALLAQKGHVFRNYYDNDDYEPYAIRTSITLYGTIITNTVWTWSWVFVEDGPVVSGYATTNTTYDPYLLYSPPPDFPSEDEYEFISWEEINQ